MIELDRIILGAASWGNEYGVTNSEPMSESDVSEILNQAGKLGLAGIDTAPHYGNSELLIGLHKNSGTPVFTKVSPATRDLKEIAHGFEMSIRRLNVQSVQGVTLHDTQFHLANKGHSMSVLFELKQRGLVNSVGASVYGIEEALNAIDGLGIDYIQAPASLLNQDFIASKFLDHLSEHGVKLQLRSVYLQGILASPQVFLTGRLAGMQNYLNLARSVAENYGLTTPQLALNYVAQAAPSADLVIGVNSVSQFDALRCTPFVQLDLVELSRLFAGVDPALSDPRTW